MRYTIPKGGYARSTDYIGTTDNYRDDPNVKNLKKSIELNNEKVRKQSRRMGRIIGSLLRVRVKPRGPRIHSYYHTLTTNATHFDIYQGEDTEAMHQLRRELDTGMTPGEMRKYDRLMGQARKISNEALWRKRLKELH